MKNKIKVSVIVPVYNVQNYVKTCVESIINQTYKNLEVILINDGSTDESLKILKELQKTDNRIQVVSRENKGTLYTRLEGAKIATGEYVVYIDTDDYIDETLLSRLIEENEGINADIVQTDYIIENQIRGKKIKENNYYKNKTTIEKNNFKEIYDIFLTTYQYSGICAKLIKKDLLNNIKFQKSVNMCEDLYINLELISQAKKILFIPEAYYHYMIRENSTCTNLDKTKMKKRIKDCIYIYSLFFEYLKRWNINTDENIKIVANRIIKEAFLQVRNLFFVSSSKNEVIGILQDTLEGKEFEKARQCFDSKKANIFEVLLCQRKYKSFYWLSTFTIKPIYNIKQLIKHIYKFGKGIFHVKEDKRNL